MATNSPISKNVPMECRLAYLMGIIQVDKQTSEKIETIRGILSDASVRINEIIMSEGTKQDYGRALEAVSLLNESMEAAKQSLTFPHYNPVNKK